MAWQRHKTAIPISADYSQMALWLAALRFFSQHDIDLLAKGEICKCVTTRRSGLWRVRVLTHTRDKEPLTTLLGTHPLRVRCVALYLTASPAPSETAKRLGDHKQCLY